MSEESDFKSEKRDVETIHGPNHRGLEPGEEIRLDRASGVVFVLDEEYGEEGEEWHLVPFGNISRIKDYRVPLEDESVEESKEEDSVGEVEEEKLSEETDELENVQDIDAEYLTDQTVSELEDFVDVVYSEPVLENAIESDDRKTAIELYEARLAELQD